MPTPRLTPKSPFGAAALVAASVASGAGGVDCASATKPPPSVTSNDAGGTATPLDFCNQCELVSVAPKIGLPATSELSGIAASAVTEGVYYVHNDSGDQPRFFAIDESGAVRGTFQVKGATARDWEDIAVGPCASAPPSDESCVYLGDIGDNSEQRTDYKLYRVHESALLTGGNVDVDGDALPFMYPDGSHNAETLLVHPQSGRIVIVTKANKGPSGVYSFPADWAAGKSVEPTRVGEVSFAGGSPLATGGDVHPQGRGVILRTYTHAWYFAGDGTQQIEQMLTGTACAVPTAVEVQGEALGWQRSGRGYVTVSEGAPLLHTVTCKVRAD